MSMRWCHMFPHDGDVFLILILLHFQYPDLSFVSSLTRSLTSQGTAQACPSFLLSLINSMCHLFHCVFLCASAFLVMLSFLSIISRICVVSLCLIDLVCSDSLSPYPYTLIFLSVFWIDTHPSFLRPRVCVFSPSLFYLLPVLLVSLPISDSFLSASSGSHVFHLICSYSSFRILFLPPVRLIHWYSHISPSMSLIHHLWSISIYFCNELYSVQTFESVRLRSLLQLPLLRFAISSSNLK